VTVPRSALPLVAVCALAGCGGSASTGTVATTAYRLDEQRGAFRGVTLGAPEHGVVERFGPDRGEPEGPVGPLGDDSFERGTPGTFASSPDGPSPTDRTVFLRYRGMSFGTNDRAVYVIMSSLPGTRTTKGPGVGDRLDAARRAYPELRCAEGTDAHGGAAFPYCGARLGNRRYLYFGGDPIGTVAIAQVPLRG
jgi:hypothetical protein